MYDAVEIRKYKEVIAYNEDGAIVIYEGDMLSCNAVVSVLSRHFGIPNITGHNYEDLQRASEVADYKPAKGPLKLQRKPTP